MDSGRQAEEQRDTQRRGRTPRTTAASSPAGRSASGPPGLLGLQAAAGNRAVGTVLGPRADGVPVGVRPITLQRLMDRTQLEGVAGPPKASGVFAKGGAYRSVLSAVDAYHTTMTQLWASGADARTFSRELEKRLTALVKSCTAYLKSNPASARAPHITTVRDAEVPVERERIRALTSRGDFGGLDRTRPASEVGAGAVAHQLEPASLHGAGIQAHDIPGGHGMAVFAVIDIPDHPLDPPTAPPNSVYGVSFQYFEQVDVHYDFQEADPGQAAIKRQAGQGKKQKVWNDVYAMQPEAATFTKTHGPITITWGDAVRPGALAARHGPERIGIYDKPSVDPEPNRHAHRTLRFRVVYRDANGHEFVIDAQQDVVRDGPALPSRTSYADSAGTKLVQNRGVAGSTAAVADLDQFDPVVAAIGVPPAARQAIPAFLRLIEDGTATEFVYREKLLIEERIRDAGTQKDAYKKFSRKGQDDYEIAGWHLLPYPDPAQTHKQYAVGGGLLVATVVDGRAIRMHFTDNATFRARSARGDVYPVRSFAEVLIDRAAPMPQAMRDAFLTEPATFDYLRLHPAEYDRMNAEYRARFGVELREPVQRVAAARFAAASVPAARQLFADYLAAFPSQLHNFLTMTYRTRLGGGAVPDVGAEVEEGEKLSLRQQGLGPDIVAVITAYRRDDFLDLLRDNPAASAEIEEKWNRLRGALAPFGEVLLRELKVSAANGTALATYQTMIADFGAYRHMVDRALREVRGPDVLATVKRQVREQGNAAAVPDQDSLDNAIRELDFLLGGPYQLRDFVPASGIGRFDASYDPVQGRMVVTIKYAIKFDDLAGSEQVKAGATGSTGQRAWDPTAHAAYKTAMQDAVNNSWSNQFEFALRHPGWSEHRVPVSVQMAEVPLEDAQFVISAKKNVEAPTPAQGVYQGKRKTNNQKSSVDSSNMKATLQEVDVLDKASDPTWHAILHAGQDMNMVKAVAGDRARLNGFVERFMPIPVIPGAAIDPAVLAAVEQEVRRVKQFSAIATHQRMRITTTAGAGDRALTDQAGGLVQGMLARAGFTNVEVVPVDGGGPTVTVEAVDHAGTKAAYEQGWSRLSAAHEAGHMLGLVDEYVPAASTDTVKEMVAQGLLPAGTPTTHLSAAGASSSNQKAKQTAFTERLARDDVPIPDFTQENDAYTDSIMTNGFRVMPAHYVFLKEALERMTASTVDPRFWFYA